MAAFAPHRVLRINQITGSIISAAIHVHSLLGPGLLESVYQGCLHHELRKRGFDVAGQMGLPVVYEGEKIELGFRIGLLVQNLVIVEVKSVDAIHPVHQAQLLSYLRLSGVEVGLLINFNVVHLREGIKRMVVGSDGEQLGFASDPLCSVFEVLTWRDLALRVTSVPRLPLTKNSQSPQKNLASVEISRNLTNAN